MYEEAKIYKKDQLIGLKHVTKGLQGNEIYQILNKKGSFVFQSLDNENFECIASIED